MLANRDKQLKKERGYRGKSYVRPDGSECLLDKIDWDVRKRELWDRAGGKCEFVHITNVGGNLIKQRCTSDGWIPAHIEPRYPIRDDRLSNLRLLCGEHDRQTEKQSWRKPMFGDHSPVTKRKDRQ